MGKYYANVRFETLEFEAASKEQAEAILNELIDDFSQVDTAIGWDNVGWDLFENGKGE